MFVGRYSAIVWLYIVILVVGLVCFLCVLNHIICDSAFIEIDELIKWLTTHNPIGHFQAFSHFHEISHCFSLVSILTHASIKYVTIVNLFEHFIIQGNTQITSHFAGATHSFSSPESTCNAQAHRLQQSTYYMTTTIEWYQYLETVVCYWL